MGIITIITTIYCPNHNSWLVNVIKIHHLATIQQQERLIPQPPFHSRLAHSLQRIRRIRHLRIPIPQCSPVARLSSRRQISLAERAHVVVGDVLCGLKVLEQVVHLVREVGEVALDLDVVLLRAGRDQEVVVVLDVLQFVGDDDGATGLSVFQRCGIGAACRVSIQIQYCNRVENSPSTCAINIYRQ